MTTLTRVMSFKLLVLVVTLADLTSSDNYFSDPQIDNFNNVKVYPRLRSLLQKDYFRYFKVNLLKKCPFWNDSGDKCTMRHCKVKPCTDLPIGIKGEATNNSCEDDTLDFLNKSISAGARLNLQMWANFDESTEFCVTDDDESIFSPPVHPKTDQSDYVDLLLNPERYTGYRGPSANKIWSSIYVENCFRPARASKRALYIPTEKMDRMCLEEQVYYRTISGLHASINVHLSSMYLLKRSGYMAINSDGDGGRDEEGEWGPNLGEFKRRFSPETTDGEGPNWLRNLYFVYRLEMRALVKAAPLLLQEKFYTGNDSQDFDTQMAVKDLLKVITQHYPTEDHFDESTMFATGTGSESMLLKKRQFKEHFRNVTRIMDCVGCDKCRLWGKLQTRGLGTALKILFSGDFDRQDEEVGNSRDGRFHLRRDEIVALFNAFGRLATSIYKLDDFRQMIE